MWRRLRRGDNEDDDEGDDEGDDEDDDVTEDVTEDDNYGVATTWRRRAQRRGV